MKKCLSVLTITIILLSVIACKKKEESFSQRPLRQGPIMDSPAPVPGHGTRQKIQFEVVVPPEVKEEWSAVKLSVEDKKLNKTQEFTVKLGNEFNIPNSKLTVKVGDFLPDFKMSGQIITSVSNIPNNPSVGVMIFEDGKQIFPKSGKWGWLYAKFPTIHTFQHERYALTLIEGIAKQ